MTHRRQSSYVNATPRRVSTLRFVNELILLYQQGVQCPYRSGLDGQRSRETRAAHVDLHVEGEESLLVVDFIASMISRDMCRIHSESGVTLSRLAEWCRVGRSSTWRIIHSKRITHHFLFLDDLALARDAVVIGASSTVIIWDDRRLSVKVMERTTRRPGASSGVEEERRGRDLGWSRSW